jgi:hypothetical protein
MRLFLSCPFVLSLAVSAYCPAALADATATAAGPHPRTYAVVVGSNVGGAGQAPLRFAEDDAQRIAEVLRELGHYDGNDVRILLHTDPAHVLAAIDDVATKVRSNAARGEQSEVVFYYSGHARANAVSIGGEELPLQTLRTRLSGLPSALTIVVLDACQSGSFSRVKGAEPAADFSYNSVSRLTQKGLAVMASSTSQELSQESDELKASYFTHHLVTALRGAGDSDGDGRVSLDEAYRYAYRRTLASTARTQVGEQHVTLETDLVGQGDVPVTYPAEAKAQLELPGPMEARVLVQHRASGSVAAEVQKVAGAPIRLAFVAGNYNAVVGQRSGIVECRFTLSDDRVMVLDTSSCVAVAAERSAAKGEPTDEESADTGPTLQASSEPKLREIDRWSLEASAGFIWRETDAFTDRLQEFGYQRQAGIVDLPTGRFTLGAARTLAPHIAGLIQIGTLAGDTYARSIAGSNDTASFSAYGGALYIRAFTDVVGRWLGIYGQGGFGMSLGVLNYKTAQTGVPPSSTDTSASYLLSAGVGVTLALPKVVTFYLEAGYDRAPAIHNLIGDTHDSGGVSGVMGMRFRLGENR